MQQRQLGDFDLRDSAQKHVDTEQDGEAWLLRKHPLQHRQETPAYAAAAIAACTAAQRTRTGQAMREVCQSMRMVVALPHLYVSGQKTSQRLKTRRSWNQTNQS